MCITYLSFKYTYCGNIITTQTIKVYLNVSYVLHSFVGIVIHAMHTYKMLTGLYYINCLLPLNI